MEVNYRIDLGIGESEAARYSATEIESLTRHLREPLSLGGDRQRVFDELYDVGEECSVEGWDGYQGKAISTDAYRRAYLLIEALPSGIPLPSVVPEPDGKIALEWYHSPRRVLSISTSRGCDLHYTALVGPNSSCGTEAFFGELPDAILDMLRRVMR